MTLTRDSSREILTPEQAADFLQVNRETIYRYIRDGKLLATRLGRAYRIPRASLDALIWSHTNRPDITLRDYTADELDELIKSDELTGQARAIAERATRIIEAKAERSDCP